MDGRQNFKTCSYIYVYITIEDEFRIHSGLSNAGAKEKRGTQELAGSRGTRRVISSPTIGLSPGQRSHPRLGKVRLLKKRSR